MTLDHSPVGQNPLGGPAIHFTTAATNVRIPLLIKHLNIRGRQTPARENFRVFPKHFPHQNTVNQDSPPLIDDIAFTRKNQDYNNDYQEAKQADFKPALPTRGLTGPINPKRQSEPNAETLCSWQRTPYIATSENEKSR